MVNKVSLPDRIFEALDMPFSFSCPLGAGNARPRVYRINVKHNALVVNFQTVALTKTGVVSVCFWGRQPSKTN